MTTKSLINKFFVFILITVSGLWLPGLCQGQAPVSSQIHKDSILIESWAGNCVVHRGYLNIADTTIMDNNSNHPTMGLDEDATGEADGKVISLGDGGMATYFLESPMRDKDGPDFAVFENGFREQVPPQLWFLELAFVEVSSDGINFIRFPALSKTQTATQVLTFGQLDTADIENLAGKFPAFYGTPFDLKELEGSPNLDIQSITHIRIIDVVGSLDPAYTSYDSQGNAINDPFPTPFWTGGFDLDALAILGETNTDNKFISQNSPLTIYPNPAKAGTSITISLSDNFQVSGLRITDIAGQTLWSQDINSIAPFSNIQISIPHPGIYFATFSTGNEILTKRIMIN